MQTLFVPKYNLHYRINPRNPMELQWSRKPFGPMTQWQHAMTFKSPIRALDMDDKTKQGVVVLNDSSTYVGSGVRTWCKKFYPAGTRLFSLYAIGEAKEDAMKKCSMKRKQESIDESSNISIDDNYVKYLMNFAKELDKLMRDIKKLMDSYGIDGRIKAFKDNLKKLYIDGQLTDSFLSAVNSIGAIKTESVNKRSLKNKLYKALKPVNGKYYSDENWQAIQDFKKIVADTIGEDLRLDIWCPNGGYRTSSDGYTHWKEYEFEIYDENNKTVLGGHINCGAAGTVQDPFSRYDVTITIY